ncbi:MAG: hypothetical protein HC873_01230 [Leptolyngbyaceae cyanobacterium SL_1_1]|nr:hypothetical protein [Leptolyngbyaceae cyanobacterium SL_1_1]
MRQAGINRLTTGILLGAESESITGWQQILQQVPTQTLYATTVLAADYLEVQELPVGQTTDLDAAQIQNLGANSAIVRILFQDQAWLSIGRLPSEAQQQLAQAGELLKVK